MYDPVRRRGGDTLAIVLGVATTALAAVLGDPLRLGQNNVVNNALTALAGARAGGPVMLVDNNSNAAGSRALDLREQPGRAPLTVKPDAGKAPNLDTDQLDGRDASSFIPNRPYRVSDTTQGPGGGQVVLHRALCDEGDLVLSGGGGAGGSFFEDPLMSSDPRGDLDGWFLTLRDNGTPSPISALCADFPPLRP